MFKNMCNMSRPRPGPRSAARAARLLLWITIIYGKPGLSIMTWFAMVFKIMCFVVLVLLPVLQSARAQLSACDDLHNTNYRDNELERNVSVNGRAVPVRVYWDGSAPSLASAALLAAALRHSLRVRVRLRRARGVCAVAAGLRADLTERLDEVALMPAGVWGAAEDACAALTLGPAAPRLRVLNAGAAPRRLRLYARLAEPTPHCRNATRWMFYTSKRELIPCNFNDTTRAGIIFHYPVEWKELALELSRRASEAGVTLRPAAMLADRAALARPQGSSLLFLDYDMWAGLPDVQAVEPPPGFRRDLDLTTVRVADVHVLRTVAPKILKLFLQFNPTANSLRESLGKSSNRTALAVEEAACDRAIGAHAQFQEWSKVALRTKGQVYEAAIFLCDNDPDWAEYKNAADEIKNMTQVSLKSSFNLRFVYFTVDCGDEHALTRELAVRSQSAQWARVVGAVGAGRGAGRAADAASALDAALAVYDAPAAALAPAARAPSAGAAHLARALARFLSLCGWTRLVVLSDRSALASGLVARLRADRSLNVKDASAEPATAALDAVVGAGGRIVFVNTDAPAAASVLCAAYERGLTADAAYVWIVREWHAADAACGGRAAALGVFTLSSWWRGGGGGVAGGAVARALQRRWRGRAWPLRAAPFADAVSLLLHGFERFMRDHPRRQTDLHGENATGLLWKAVDEMSVEGVTQPLILNRRGLVTPLIFVDHWNGSRAELVAVWRIEKDEVVPVDTRREIFKGEIPSDGVRPCHTARGGDRFTPTCFDGAILGALASAGVALPLLYAARAVRRGRLARRDRGLTARLLAATALADHLVDRARLDLRHHLGSGRFGTVRFAFLRPPGRAPVAVAAKALRDEVSPAEEREFLNEACTLASLRHDRIVRLVGVCATGGPPLLLMAHAFYRDLLRYLIERRHLAGEAGEAGEAGGAGEARHVSAAALTRLARDAAAALEYLASRRVVHRDVRAANCLVDAQRSLKLADFGMARRADAGAGGAEYSSRRRGLFPVLWMAPESLERGVFTPASDAWALGVLLLELVTLGERPFGAWSPLRVMRYVSAGGRPPLPPDVGSDARRVLAACWRRAPGSRASAAAVRATLDAQPRLLHPAPRRAGSCRRSVPHRARPICS